ncbi:MAG: SIS domain-containing protein [Gemmatimonadaceae bacterium]
MSLDFIHEYLAELDTTLRALPHEQIAGIIRAIRDVRDRDAQLFVVGNGGSASTASHFAVDLGKGASLGGERRFRVMSLTDNVPWISALANDLSYDDVFVEQLKNFARSGDLLLAFSGSGNSENVLRAVRYANSIGCHTIGLAGYAGGRLREEARECLVVQADHMGRIEDGHFVVQHLIVYYFMSRLDAEPILATSAVAPFQA